MVDGIYEMAQAYMIPFLVGIPVLVLLFLFDAKIDLGKLRSSNRERAAADREEREARRARRSILVVDDSAVARVKLRKLLEGADFDVVAVEDGEKALAAMQSRAFALVITDLEMPKMNGFELIASIQGSIETEDTPIIAITGHDDLQARVRDCQGLFGIFKKPWNDRELLKRAEALCAMATPMEPVQRERGGRTDPAL